MTPDISGRAPPATAVCTMTGRYRRLMKPSAPDVANAQDAPSLRRSRIHEGAVLAMEASHDGYWDWVAEGDDYYASPRMLEICGFPPETVFAGRQDFLERFPFHPQDRPRWIEQARLLFAGTATRYSTELRMVREGQIKWLHLSGLCTRDASGTPLRWTGSISNVTERKLAEEALLASDERYALAVAGSTDGLWDWNVATDEMFLSERAQSLYGLVPGPTVRRRAEWQSMIDLHPEDVEPARRLEQSYLAGVPPYDGEWRVRGGDGVYRWIRVRGICVRDADGRAIRLAGSVSDIDLRRRAEVALRRSQRLEATGILAGGIAHDFNNILGVILGYVEMALRDAPLGSRLRRDLDNIAVAGDRGRSLVDRILAFSRSGVGQRVPVGVEGVVREVLDLLAPTLPDIVRMEVDLAAGRAAVLGDLTQMHQVLMNLATNAVQAMPSGGTLGVSVRAVDIATARPVATGVLVSGSYLVIAVSDTGSGVDPEIVDRVFDPFFTTREAGGGTGLGLSLVHGIVTDMGGAIDIASRVGEGSVFSVYLPQHGEAEPRPADTAPSILRGAHQQVLVVDDEVQLVSWLTEVLSDLSYVPVGFSSSVEALAAFRAHADRFDAVITDERMPGLSGTSLIRALRAIRPDIPVLLLSGYPSASANQAAESAVGADEILRKPIASHALAAAVSRVLRKSPGVRR